MKLHCPSAGFGWTLLAVTLTAGSVWLGALSVPAEAYKGKPVEEWFEGLIDFEPAEAFAEMGTNAVPFLRAKLAKHDELRNQAVALLRRATPKRWAAKLPQNTWAEGERKDAAFALWWMGPDVTLPESDLRRALQDDSDDVCHYAVIMLGERGGSEDALLAECRKWLQNSNYAGQALRLLITSPALVNRINRDELLRVCCDGKCEFSIIACARFYQATHDCRFLDRLESLVAASNDSDDAIFGAFERWWLTGEGDEGLCALYSSPGKAFDNPALIRASDLLHESDDAALLPSCRRCEPAGGEVRRHELIAALSELQDQWLSEMDTNHSALDGELVEIEILSNLPSVRPGFVPILRQHLRAREFLGRLHAARALGRVGPAAAPAVPDLRRMLRSECALDRIGAAEALWRIERRPEEVLPVLEACLNAPGARVRGTAGRALLVVEQDASGTLSPPLRQSAQRAFERSSVPSVMGILLRLEI